MRQPLSGYVVIGVLWVEHIGYSGIIRQPMHSYLRTYRTALMPGRALHSREYIQTAANAAELLSRIGHTLLKAGNSPVNGLLL